MLLIARPMVHAATFRRTVLLLCEHNDEGSFGLVLNRRLDLTLDDVVGDVVAVDRPLSLGGPVQTDTLHFLHRFGVGVPGGIPVLDDVHWGGDFETVKQLAADSSPDVRDVRFFIGYAGWGAGQLEEEIEQDAWVLTPAYADAVFTGAPDDLWRQVLREMGGDYAVLANFPENPRLN